MNENQLYYTLALQKTVGVGFVLGRRLVEEFGSAEEVFSRKKKDLIRIEGITDKLLCSLENKSIFEDAEKELIQVQSNKWKATYINDWKYPKLLKECVDAPLVLFSSKELNWNNERIISIVGSRQATTRGVEFCNSLLDDLKEYNPIIVSGYAYGIDITSHKGALDRGLQTIGVLGHGLNQLYPSEHAKYVEEMNESGGFVTEFWSSDAFNRENFIKRNRIIAGLSTATIVIESAFKGGSLNTVRFANDYNRDVYAVPGRISDPMSKGCNDLIKTSRAAMLTDATDLIKGLNWEKQSKKQKAIQTELSLALTSDEQNVYEAFRNGDKEFVEIIAEESCIPVFRVTTVLLNLEVKGLVRPLPGNYYERL